MSLPEDEIKRLTTEILLCKQEAVIKIIEIGRRLIKAKELIPRGEWEAWLDEKVEFSYRQAARYMQVARELGNVPTLAGLAPSKVFALLDVAPGQREEFIHRNPVNKMSVKEFKEAIRDKKEAERRAKEAESQAHNLVGEVQSLKTKLSKLPIVIEKEVIPENFLREKDKLQEENELLKSNLEKAQSEVQVIEKEVIPPDYEKIKAKVQEQQEELHHIKKAQFAKKDMQKVKTDTTLLIKELVKKTERLKLYYTQADEHDQETIQQIELTAKTCDRIAQELRLLIQNRKTTGGPFDN